MGSPVDWHCGTLTQCRGLLERVPCARSREFPCNCGSTPQWMASASCIHGLWAPSLAPAPYWGGRGGDDSG